MTIQGSKIDSSIPAVAGTLPAERVPAPAEQSRAEHAATVRAEPQPREKPRPAPQEDLGRVRAAIAERLDKFMKDSGRSVEFRVDDDAHATVLTVRRADTGEVVRQYPTEEALSLLRRLNEQSGTFVDLMA
jgi:flagellar protein FlaG